MNAMAQKRSDAAKKAHETMRLRRNAPPKPKVKLPPKTKVALPKQAQWASASEMMAKTVVLVLTLNQTGNRRQVDSEEFQVVSNEGDGEEWFNTTKKLLDAEELKQIQSLYGKAKRDVLRRALPMVMKQGVYLLPVGVVDETISKLKEVQAELEPLVDKMCSRLPALIADAKTRLSKVKVGKEVKNFFNEDDYPTKNELRAKFAIRWRLVYIDSAKNLEAVSKELYEEERKKAEADWTETRETIKTLLRTQLSQLVNHLVEKLQPDDEGRVMKIQDRAIDKFTDFLETFNARNITGDAQMKALVDQAKSLINIGNAETLHTDKNVREYVLDGFEEIKSLLDPMVGVKPHRAIKLID